jgi:glycine/D-amino acid oxidase-like deaminating enzyme
MTPASAYSGLSLWHDDVRDDLSPRPSLESDIDADVAIIGGGYTGLWTAYYLKQSARDLRTVIIESEIAGFGASGRNGGWCIGMLTGIDTYLEDPQQRAGGVGLLRAIFDTVDEVQRVCECEGIDCHYDKGGSIRVATAPAQVRLLQSRLAKLRGLGFTEADFRWLPPQECAHHVGMANALGGLFTSHCASLHPARLARGLAAVVERLGVEIYEKTPAITLEGASVVTPAARIRAPMIVRAMEGYTRRLAGEGRRLVPIHSMMIATEPLPAEIWKEIGLARRQTFGDARRVVTYGQRTRDGRLAFGGRGNYYYRSGIRDRFEPTQPDFERVHRTLVSFFPALASVAITHRWGGPLGIPRHWLPSVGVDHEEGRAWGGGYSGEGVAAANLAGRTLADLILRQDTPRTQLPWVTRDFPLWEPEPLRWLGVTGLRRLADSADTKELQGGAAPLRSAVFSAFARM